MYNGELWILKMKKAYSIEQQFAAGVARRSSGRADTESERVDDCMVTAAGRWRGMTTWKAMMPTHDNREQRESCDVTYDSPGSVRPTVSSSLFPHTVHRSHRINRGLARLTVIIFFDVCPRRLRWWMDRSLTELVGNIWRCSTLLSDDGRRQMLMANACRHR